jgi:hypothetical protein
MLCFVCHETASNFYAWAGAAAGTDAAAAGICDGCELRIRYGFSRCRISARRISARRISARRVVGRGANSR